QEEHGRGQARDDPEGVGVATRPTCAGSPSREGERMFPKAPAAKAASRANPRATSSSPRAPVAAAASRSTEMPPVPSSWAAMVRSTLAGPARMRTRPTATVSRMNPAAASRNSVMAQHLAEQRLLPGKVGGDWLGHVETMDQQLTVLVGSRRQSARQQARHRGEGARRAARQMGAIGDEARADRHRRMERKPGDLHTRTHRLTEEVQNESGKRPLAQPDAAGRQKAQTGPSRKSGSGQANRQIGGVV